MGMRHGRSSRVPGPVRPLLLRAVAGGILLPDLSGPPVVEAGNSVLKELPADDARVDLGAIELEIGVGPLRPAARVPLHFVAARHVLPVAIQASVGGMDPDVDDLIEELRGFRPRDPGLCQRRGLHPLANDEHAFFVPLDRHLASEEPIGDVLPAVLHDDGPAVLVDLEVRDPEVQDLLEEPLVVLHVGRIALLPRRGNRGRPYLEPGEQERRLLDDLEVFLRAEPVVETCPGTAQVCPDAQDAALGHVELEDAKLDVELLRQLALALDIGVHDDGAAKLLVPPPVEALVSPARVGGHFHPQPDRLGHPRLDLEAALRGHRLERIGVPAGQAYLAGARLLDLDVMNTGEFEGFARDGRAFDEVVLAVAALVVSDGVLTDLPALEVADLDADVSQLLFAGDDDHLAADPTPHGGRKLERLARRAVEGAVPENPLHGRC